MEIASCVHGCLAKFKALEDNGHVDFPSVEDEHGRFRVWTGNISAHRTGRRSLEYRLRDSSNLQQTVTTLLKDLEAVLERLQELVETARTEKGRSGSLSFEDEPAQAEIPDDDDDDAELFGLGGEEASARALFEQALEEAHDVITCLLRFSMTLRNPARHDQLKQAAATTTKHFEPHDIKHVQEKYPETPDFLKRRLGKAITKHRQYLKYREEHHVKLAEGLEDRLEAHEERPSTIATSIVHSDDFVKLSDHVALVEETESVYTATSFAPTTAGDAALRPPPRPGVGKNGEPFECPLCYGIVVARDERSWRQHVYEDLPPYICTFESCISGDHRYSWRRDWQRHQANSHNRHWLCPFGCHGSIHSEPGFQEHLARQHGESLGSDSLQRMADACAISDEIVDLLCPLCKEGVPTVERWYKHLGHHLEQLTLHALPKHMLGTDSDDELDLSFAVEFEAIMEEEDLTESEDVDLLDDEAYYEPPTQDAADSELPSTVPTFGNAIDEEGQIESPADEIRAFLSASQQSRNEDLVGRSDHSDSDVKNRWPGDFAGNDVEMESGRERNAQLRREDEMRKKYYDDQMRRGAEARARGDAQAQTSRERYSIRPPTQQYTSSPRSPAREAGESLNEALGALSLDPSEREMMAFQRSVAAYRENMVAYFQRRGDEQAWGDSTSAYGRPYPESNAASAGHQSPKHGIPLVVEFGDDGDDDRPLENQRPSTSTVVKEAVKTRAKGGTPRTFKAYYEGWSLERIKTGPGESLSWQRCTLNKLLCTQEELVALVKKHMRETRTKPLRSDFKRLSSDKQGLINRILDKKHLNETSKTAEWTLVDVQQFQRPTGFLSNEAYKLQIVIKRTDKGSDKPEAHLYPVSEIIDLAMPLEKRHHKDGKSSIKEDSG